MPETLATPGTAPIPLREDSKSLEEVRGLLFNLYEFDEIEQWLSNPHKLLGGRVALDCSSEEVLRLVHQLSDGVYI